MGIETPDYASMSDEQLTQMEASAFNEEAAPETPEPAPEPQQAAQPEEGEQQPAPAASQEQESEAERVQRRVPLEEHIALRHRAQEAERLAQEAQRRLEAIEAERQRSAHQAEYDRLYEEVGPEAAEHYRQSLANQHAERERLTQETQQQATHQRVALAEEFARAAWPDYDAQIAKVVERFGAQEAYRLAAQQPNPAKWAYELGKSWESAEERQKTIDAAVAKAVKEALSKQSPPPSRGQTSVGHLSSTAPGHVSKSYEEMTDAELEEADREARTKW